MTRPAILHIANTLKRVGRVVLNDNTEMVCVGRLRRCALPKGLRDLHRALDVRTVVLGDQWVRQSVSMLLLLLCFSGLLSPGSSRHGGVVVARGRVFRTL